MSYDLRQKGSWSGILACCVISVAVAGRCYAQEAVTVTLDLNGVLRVEGRSLDDLLYVWDFIDQTKRKIKVTIQQSPNDWEAIFLASKVKAVIINGNEGNDRIVSYLSLASIPFYANGGPGDDNLHASSATNGVNILHGGPGDDLLSQENDTGFSPRSISYGDEGNDYHNCDGVAATNQGSHLVVDDMVGYNSTNACTRLEGQF